MKLHVLIILCFFTIVSSATQDYSALNKSLHLDALIQAVIDCNPDLAAARRKVKAAAAAIIPPQTLDDPEFMVRNMDTPLNSHSRFHTEMWYELSQKIPFPGKLSLKGKIAEQQRELVRSEEITTLLDLVFQAKKLYYRLYFNMIAHTINEQNREIVSLLIQSALALYKTGHAKQADVLKAEIELQILDEEFFNIEREKAAIIAFLNALLNRPQSAPLGKPVPVYHKKFPLDYDRLEALALQERPEIYGIKSTIEEYNLKAQLARKNYYPDFEVAFMFEQMPGRKDKAWSLMLKLNLPIWIGQRQRNEKREAEFTALSKTLTLEGIENTIRGKIKELLANLDAVQEKIFLYESGLLTKLGETFASYVASYRVGKSDILMVLDTRRQLQTIERDYEGIRVEREILLAELEREIGIPLEKIYAFFKKSETPSFLDPALHHIFWNFKPWDGKYTCVF